MDTVGKLPNLFTRAEAALDDYDRERNSPGRRNTQRMLTVGFWILVLIAVVLIVRLFH
jgi:ubiquinone biosynthesis protein